MFSTLGWTACCKIPSRYILAIMMLLGFTNAFAQRMVFNIALVAMVNFTQPDTNGTSSDECAANTKPGQNSTIQTPVMYFLTYFSPSEQVGLQSVLFK